MDNNRRTYFRIHTNLNYELIEISSEEASIETLHRLAHKDYHLLKEVSRLQYESKAMLNLIEDKNREVAAFLQTVEQRIDTLSHLVIGQQMQFTDSALSSDLSAGGLRLIINKSYEINQYAFLHLLLCPSMLYIPTIAKVIKVEPMTEGYSVFFEFDYIEEDDRDKIIKHVIQLQALQKRHEEDS
jgi:hypothetical protein